MERWIAMLAALLGALAALGCSSCGQGDGSGGDGIDGGTDTDTDSDTDVDTETDTDSLLHDGGPLVPCEGDAEPDEVCIPGGTYLMGCMPYDTWCEDNELPMVEVTLSPFFIERIEATYEEVLTWLNSVDDGYIKEDQWFRDSEGNILWRSAGQGGPPICYDADAGAYEYYEFNTEECCDPDTCCGGPLEAAAGGFSWLGAKLFCEWQGKRLPTEAEWEAAARGQTKLIWPCDWEHKPCWHGKYAMCFEGDECYADLYCCSPREDDNMSECNSPDGVRGMYGNANEYVLDGLDEDHSWCADGCIDPPPRPANEDGEHVGKGGGIADDATWTRISARLEYGLSSETNGCETCGVRCVRSQVSFD